MQRNNFNHKELLFLLAVFIQISAILLACFELKKVRKSQEFQCTVFEHRGFADGTGSEQCFADGTGSEQYLH